MCNVYTRTSERNVEAIICNGILGGMRWVRLVSVEIALYEFGARAWLQCRYFWNSRLLSRDEVARPHTHCLTTQTSKQHQTPSLQSVSLEQHYTSTMMMKSSILLLLLPTIVQGVARHRRTEVSSPKSSGTSIPRTEADNDHHQFQCDLPKPTYLCLFPLLTSL
jgi:hypothetical protein